MAANKYNLQRSRIASTNVFDMDDVNGGNSGDAYDSVVVAHCVRLLCFFSFVHVRFIVRDVHRIVESSEVEKSRSLKSGRDSSCLPAS